MILSTDLRTTCPKPFKRGKKGTYCIRQRVLGKDVWRSLRTTNKKEAEYLTAAIWRAQQGMTMRELIPAAPMPLDMIWARYIETDRFIMLADSTKQTKLVTWRAFTVWAKSQRISYSTELTAEAAERYLDTVGKKNKTFNNVLGDLRTVFSVAEENPFDSLKPKPIRRGAEGKVSTRINAFSDADAARIIDYIRNSPYLTDRDERADLCVVLDNSGMRYEDAAKLKHSSEQVINGVRCLVFAPSKTTNSTGGREVIVNLTPELADALDRRRHNGSDYVFPALAAEYAVRMRHASQWLNKIFTRLGIDSSTHGFRVRLVTKAALAGVDLGDFGGVVGHSTEAQTNAYNRAAQHIDLTAITERKL